MLMTPLLGPSLTEGSRSESEIGRPGVPAVRNGLFLKSYGWAPHGSVLPGAVTVRWQMASQSLTTVGLDDRGAREQIHFNGSRRALSQRRQGKTEYTESI